MISWLNRHQAPKTILLIFGGTRTPEKNQEQIWYHFQKYYFSKYGNHTFFIYLKACVQCFCIFFIKGRVFHFYHFCEERHQEMMKIPVTISKRCISISYLSKIKRGFGKFCVFKQGIPQHPQHSDSYLCTWAMWSRSECVGCFVFSNFCLFSVGFNYAQMANSWFRTDCNLFWTCLELPNVNKYRPSDPLVITEILQRYKNWWTRFKTYCFS